MTGSGNDKLGLWNKGSRIGWVEEKEVVEGFVVKDKEEAKGS